MSKPGSPADGAPPESPSGDSGEWSLYDAETNVSVEAVATDPGGAVTDSLASAEASLDTLEEHRDDTGPFERIDTKRHVFTEAELAFDTDGDFEAEVDAARATDPEGHDDDLATEDRFPRVGLADDDITATGVDPPLDLLADNHLGFLETQTAELSSLGSKPTTLELPHRPSVTGQRLPASTLTPAPATDLEPTQARAAVLSNWARAVAGLRVEAARATDNATRGRLLTVAAGLTWQLIGDHDDADHLLDQALQAEPELLFARRERALMRMREGRDPVETLLDLADGLNPRDRYDHRRRVRGRFYTLAAVHTYARARAGDSRAAERAAKLEELARQDLEGTALVPLWAAYRAWDEQRADFPQRYLDAIRHCRLGRLRAALLADLAAGLWANRYHGEAGPELDAQSLINEAAELDPKAPLYGSLRALLSAGHLSEEHRQLQGLLDRAITEPVTLRAAAVAEAVGEAHVALGVIELLEGQPTSPRVDWRLSRLAARWGEPSRALAAITRLRQRASGELLVAALALEEASLHAVAGNTRDWERCVAEAHAAAADLDAPLQELGRHLLRTNAYRDLMDLRAFDLRASASVHTRRGEILETRLSSPVEAVSEYAAALRAQPDDLVAFRALERLYAYTGDDDGLSRLYRDRAQHETGERAVDLLRLAAQVDLFERGNPDDAAAAYDRLVDLEPGNLVLRRERVEALFRAGHAARACQLVDELLPELDDEAEVRLLAHDRLSQHHVPVPVATLQGLLSRVPATPLVRERLESACLSEGADAALLAFLEGHAVADSRDDQLLLAEARIRAGHAADAVGPLETFIQEHGADGVADWLLERALAGAGDSERLQDRWRELASTRLGRPDIAEPLFEWLQGLDHQAAASLVAAVDSAADERVIWAATLMAASEDEARATAAQACLACDPRSDRLKAVVETVLVGTNQRQALLPLYLSWARGAGPLERDYLLGRLAHAYLTLEQPEDALTIWTKLAQLQPDFAPAEVGRLIALSRLGRKSEAAILAAELVERFAYRPGADSGGLWALFVAQAESESDDGRRALLWLEASRLAQASGNHSDALQSADKALALVPELAVARRRAWTARALAGAPSPAGDLDGRLVVALLGGLEAADDEALGECLRDGTDPDAIALALVAGRRGGSPARTLSGLQSWTRWGRDSALLGYLDLQIAWVAELEADQPEAALDAYDRCFTRRPDDLWIATHVARLAARNESLGGELSERLGGLAGQGAGACPALYWLAEAQSVAARTDTYALVLSLDSQFLPAEWGLLTVAPDQLSTGALARRARRRVCPSLLVEAARRSVLDDDSATAESLLYEALSMSEDEDIGSFGGAYDGLIDVLRDRGRGVELIALGEDLVRRASSTAVRRRLLEAAVRVALGPGTSRSVARSALGQLLGAAPADRAQLRRAIALAAQAGDWEVVTGHLELEAPLLAELYPALAGVVWWEIGEIRRRRDDLDGALDAFGRARELEHGGFLARTAIGRLFIEEGRWDELVEHIDEQIRRSDDPVVQARLHVNLAGIDEFHRLDVRRALEHYLEALALDPENRSALIGTVRIGERAGQPAAAGVAMEVLAGFLPGVDGRALLLRAAEIAELHQSDTALAFELYQRLAEQGDDAFARPGLDACLLRLGGVEKLLESYRDDSQAPTIQTLLSPVVEPDWLPDEPAPAALWAARIFRPLTDDGSRPRSAAAKLGETLGDASAAADLIRLGLLIGALHGAPTDRNLRQTLVLLDPADALGLLKIEADAAPGSVEERWAIDARIRLAPEGLQRAEAMTGLLRHFALKGQDDQLWDTLDRLKAEAPELPLANHYRAAMATNDDEPTRAAQRFEQEAKVAVSKARSAQLWLQGALLRRRQLGDVERAVADLWSSLEADPTTEEAFRELREILVTQGDLEGLYQLFDLRFRGLPDVKQRVVTLARMAELAHDRLHDKARAAWCHREILRLDPTQVRSYRILAEILLTQQSFADAAEMLEAVVDHTDRKPLLIKTRLQLAEIYIERLDKHDAAEAHLRAILADEPDHEAALQGVARLCERSQRWEEATECLDRLSRGAGTRPSASKLYLRLAHALEKTGGAEAATAVGRALRRAVEVRPDNKAALRALAKFVNRTELARPVDLLVKQVADRFGTDEASPNEDKALVLLVELYEALGWTRRGDLVFDLLDYLGYADEIVASRPRRRVEATPWRAWKPVPAERTASVFPPQLRPAIVNVLRSLDPVLAKAFPSRAKLLGASRKTRIGRTTNHPAVALTRLLGRPDTEVHACLAPLSRPALEPGASGNYLLLPSDFDEDACDDASLWSLGFALAPAAMGFATMSRLPATVWIDVVVQALRADRPDYLIEEQRIRPSDDLRDRVDAVLTRKLLDAMGEDISALQGLNYDGLEVQHRLLQVSFARLAGLSAIDLSMALREVAVHGPGPTCARAMVPFLISPEFFELQQAAGVVPESIGDRGH